MIKLTYCLARLPHLTRAEFLDYWLNKHGPLVQMHAGTLNLCRYAQHHNQDHPINEAIRKARDAPDSFDGVAELWWDSMEAMQEAFSSEQGRAASKELMEDEKHFIDHRRSPLWIGEEKILVGD